MKRAVYVLNNIAIKYNFMILVNKTKAMAMKRKMDVRIKTVLCNHIIEPVDSFNYLVYVVAAMNNRDLRVLSSVI
jgi:hypothetical protein